MKKKLISRLKEFRTQKGLSQQQLADAVDARRETIVRLERGEYNPSLELAMDIANVLEASLLDIFRFEEE